MRVVCIDVVIEIRALRSDALENLGRAVWLAMTARLTGGARWIAVANEQLRGTLTCAVSIEDLLVSPETGSYE